MNSLFDEDGDILLVYARAILSPRHLVFSLLYGRPKVQVTVAADKASVARAENEIFRL